MATYIPSSINRTPARLNRTIMKNATPNPSRSLVKFNRTTIATPSLSRDESQTLLNFSLEDAFDYIESYIVDSGIDFNVYQFSQRPVFVTFVRLVTACFVSIGDKSMNFNQRTKMEDVWKKLNSQ